METNEPGIHCIEKKASNTAGNPRPHGSGRNEMRKLNILRPSLFHTAGQPLENISSGPFSE